MSLPFNDVLTIMAGTWYIPGIGKIIVAGVLKGKTKNRKTSGDTHVYEGSGGKRAAERDFNKLNEGKA